MPRLLCVFLVVFALFAAGCSSSSSNKTAPPNTPPTTQSASKSPNPSGSIGHVFVINLENENYATTWGSASPAKYLNSTLVPMGVLLENYYAIGHVSLDNYIAEISGQSPNPETQADCFTYTDFKSTGFSAYGQAKGQGCVYPKGIRTIADQLAASGKTWRGYMEDMGTPCRHPTVGTADPSVVAKKGDMYVTRHNPFVYFHSIIDDAAKCAEHVVDFKKLEPDLASVASTPNLSFITPNLCNDGHDHPCIDGRPGGLTSADAFLKALVPKILASPAYKQDGMLVITLDESENDSTACCDTPPSPNTPKPGGGGPGGGRVGTLILSPEHAKVGAVTKTSYNHYSLLCSMEKAFGLSRLGFAAVPSLPCFGNDIYASS